MAQGVFSTEADDPFGRGRPESRKGDIALDGSVVGPDVRIFSGDRQTGSAAAEGRSGAAG